MTSQNSSKSNKRKWWLVLALPLWVYGAFMAVQYLVAAVLWAVMYLGIPLEKIDSTIFNMTVSAITYGLSVAVVIWVPWRLKRWKTTKDDLAITGRPSWLDISLTPVAMVGYMIASAILIQLLSQILPIIVNQDQALPIDQSMLTATWQYVMAFIMLVVLAPVGEELLFRGYLYGKLRKTAPVWMAIIVASLTFGLAHLWAGSGSPLQWAVTIDTFALSLVMCMMREFTGSIWITIFMHMAKNGLAFYLLFVNTQFIDQIQAALLPFI